jgi:anti-sigma regulatory factor (Ser/Thr protein kinase)
MVSRNGSGQEPGPAPAAGDPAAGDPGAGDVVALDQRFGQDGLHGLRAAVASHAAELGAGPQCAGNLMVIANELASNAILHGGGGGRLRLWRTGKTIFCQVSDTGPGLPDPQAAGLHRPVLDARTGRGLWLVRQLADRLDARTGPRGTTGIASLALDPTSQ